MKGEDSQFRRTRDANRSKQVILDVAERLFATKGYDATTLQEIADAAGLSRGTPGYFFGSKEALYLAVLERLLGEANQLLGKLNVSEQASAETLLQTGIEAYIDFLATHPNFTKLMVREALDGGVHITKTPQNQAGLFAGLQVLAQPPFHRSLTGIDAQQLTISIIALCMFPFSQADNLLKALGQDPFDAAFIAARKQHIMQLLLHGAIQKPLSE